MSGKVLGIESKNNSSKEGNKCYYTDVSNSNMTTRVRNLPTKDSQNDRIEVPATVPEKLENVYGSDQSEQYAT